MRFARLAVAATAVVSLVSSCAAPQLVAGGGKAGGVGREAARYKVLETTTACACNAAFGAASAQNNAGIDTFNFSVVDNGTNDLSQVQVFIGSTQYRGQDEDVVIAGTVVTITGTLENYDVPTDPSIAVVITFDVDTRAFSMTVNNNLAINGSLPPENPPGSGIIAGSCELPRDLFPDIIIIPS